MPINKTMTALSTSMLTGMLNSTAGGTVHREETTIPDQAPIDLIYCLPDGLLVLITNYQFPTISLFTI